MSNEEFPPIQQRLMRFVRERFQPGYNHYNVSKLVGDASSRQYYRYVTDDGASYILAAYPEPFDTSKFTYRQIYDLLQEIAIVIGERRRTIEAAVHLFEKIRLGRHQVTPDSRITMCCQ